MTEWHFLNNRQISHHDDSLIQIMAVNIFLIFYLISIKIFHCLQKPELPVKSNAAYLLRKAARIIQEEEAEIKKYIR